MIWIINELIAFLTDLRDMPLIAQFVTLASIFSFVALLFGIPAWLMTRKVRDSVAAYEALEAQLKTARQEAAKLQAEVKAFEAATPKTFLSDYKREIEDGNNERVVALAETFVERQKEALRLAFRTRMEEAIGFSVEDGASAFATARLWAEAARALVPDDRMLGMLIDELTEAEAIAASGASVRLKGNADRRDRAARMDQLPGNLVALTTAFWHARDCGHYALMLVLAEHGLTLTRRRPFGEGTQQHLLFRFFRGVALTRGGHVQSALAELEALLPLQTKVTGAQHANVLMIRYYIGLCRRINGDAAGALADLEALLPLKIEVLGAQHPDTVTTRGLIAACRQDTGDATSALSEFEALLPVKIEVLGSRHPDTLTTRGSIAACRRDTGDVAGALVEFKVLLPLQTDVIGARHPDVNRAVFIGG